jgi:Asp-tRNA(Asn)/Glu-tRNA(Gln) amidotransferase A subunit family amidase
MDKNMLHYMDINSIAQQLHKNKLAPLDLVEHFLTRIESLNAKLNAFRIVCKDKALVEAKAASVAIKKKISFKSIIWDFLCNQKFI